MNKKKQISVCFSPDLFHYYNKENLIVVVVDILRATTVISTAFEYGIKSVIPVETLEEALSYKEKENYIIAAERNTKIIEGFNFGNSPHHYMNKDIKEKELVLTTTNGTKAIHKAKENILITASYINIDAVKRYLIQEQKDIVILCSGWKNRFNLEDSIFAGDLATLILDSNKYISNCDSLSASQTLFRSAKSDLFRFLENSAYRKRNQSVEVIKDTKFCLTPAITSNIIPFFINGRLEKRII